MREELLQRFLFDRFESKAPRESILQLLDIAQSPERQTRLRALISECREISDADESQRHFAVQGAEETTAAFDELYIDRSLTDAVTGVSTSVDVALDLAHLRPRAVIIGDPGVGKTTLTAWLRWRLRREGEATGPPLAVTITSRHHLSRPGSSELGGLRKSFAGQYVRELSSEEERDMLSVCAVALIVDGIDEILDATQRRSIVQQLHQLAEKYPALAVLCTTRRRGFEVSLFRPATFKLYNLEEYTDAQVEEYAGKWFGQFSEGLRAERFIGESRRIVDLRRNPLMLALLCTLYRQYDYIPRSRRDVYLRCASLMFHEWDPRRGIDIPNLFKVEGENILREVALVLWQGGGVSASIDERQLHGVVSRYLVDKGEDSASADRSARELIEHCSGRAWILTRIGDRSVKRFAFTHRTFFEFFCAEAIVRRLNRENELVGHVRAEDSREMSKLSQQVLAAYSADPTSVLPELLVQAADDLMGGVAPAILAEMRAAATAQSTSTKAAAIIGLAVRLIASVGVNAEAADRVFRTMVDVWRGGSEILMEHFTPLLDVAAGHRARLIGLFASDWAAGYEFLRRYARIVTLGEAGLFSDDWMLAARKIAGETDWESVVEAVLTEEATSAEQSTDDGLEGYASLDSLMKQVVSRDRQALSKRTVQYQRVRYADGHVTNFGVVHAEVPVDVALRCTDVADALVLRVGKTEAPGVFWRSICPADDRDGRLAVWQDFRERLIHARIRSNVLLGASDFVAVSRPLPEDLQIPVELALQVGLLLGPQDAADFGELVGIPWLEQLVDHVGRLRQELHAFESRVPTEEERRRARRAAGETLNGLCRTHLRKTAPTWLRDYVGVRSRQRLVLLWDHEA